jgi:hypothetical protein
MTKPPKKKSAGTPGSAEASPAIPNIADRGLLPGRVPSISTGLLSNVPYSVPSSSNIFGIGSKHPFANYWTCEGGLPEVLSVLPEKLQADMLLSQYFECVDPVYPSKSMTPIEWPGCMLETALLTWGRRSDPQTDVLCRLRAFLVVAET